jgi:colicin import membrane protein
MISRRVKNIILQPTPIVLSTGIHFIAVIIIISISSQGPVTLEPTPIKSEIVNAIAVDREALEREIKSIRSAEAQEEKVLKRQLDLAMRKRNEAVKKREAEEKRLQEIKKRTKKLELAARKAAADKVKAEKKALLAAQKAEKERKLAAKAELERKKAEKQKNKVEAARDLAQANAQSAADENEINKVLVAIRGRVMRSFNVLPNFQGLSCILNIRLLSDGNVAGVVVVESSGNETFDRHAENAVRKASPLPVPESVRLFQKMRSLSFEFDPML